MRAINSLTKILLTGKTIKLVRLQKPTNILEYYQDILKIRHNIHPFRDDVSFSEKIVRDMMRL